MQRIILIDPQWNNHTFLKKKILEELSDSNKKVETIDINDTQRKSNIFRYYSILKYHLVGLRLLSTKNKVIFLSYHTFLMYIATKLVNTNNKKIHVYEHNNIDRLGKNFLYDHVYKSLNKSLISICFEAYIKNFIKDNYKRESIVIPQPVIDYPKQKIIQERMAVFSPSGKTSKSTIDHFSKLKSKYEFYFKGPKFKYKNIIVNEYYKNYDSLFNEANIILFDHVYNYRISGVLYEAMQLNKIIISKYCRFATYISTKYQNIHIYEDIKEVDEALLDNLIQNKLSDRSYRLDNNHVFSGKLHDLFF